MGIGQELKTRWEATGMRLPLGASPEDVSQFEERQRVVLPADFRDYLFTTNGMLQSGGYDEDDKGFAFYPLEKLRDVSTRPEVSATLKHYEMEKAFTIVSYLQSSWDYAILLSRSKDAINPVVMVGVKKPQTVGHSFSAFVREYFSDSPLLCPLE